MGSTKRTRKIVTNYEQLLAGWHDICTIFAVYIVSFTSFLLGAKGIPFSSSFSFESLDDLESFDEAVRAADTVAGRKSGLSDKQTNKAVRKDTHLFKSSKQAYMSFPSVVKLAETVLGSEVLVIADEGFDTASSRRARFFSSSTFFRDFDDVLASPARSRSSEIRASQSYIFVLLSKSNNMEDFQTHCYGQPNPPLL